MERDPADDWMNLSEAALLVCRRIIPGAGAVFPEDLDAAAALLARHLHVLGIRDGVDQAFALTPDDYRNGSFRRGATRFEFRDPAAAPVWALKIERAQLRAALEYLEASWSEAKR